MLTQLDAISTSEATADTLTCHLDNRAVLDSIQCQDIQGLDPVKAAINTTQYADIDGAYVTGESTDSRNIVLTFGYNPDWVTNTIEALRQTLYQYFMPRQTVRLTFTSTHLPTVQIDGIVESMDPNIFSQDPQVQVSIICPAPAFLGITPVTVNLTAYAMSATPTLVDTIGYTGSLPAPIHLAMHKQIGGIDYDDNILIQNGAQSFEVEGGVSSIFYFTFDSTDGERDVRVIGESDPLINQTLMTFVTGPQTWVKLLPGLNPLFVKTIPGGQNVVVTYTPRFGGL